MKKITKNIVFMAMTLMASATAQAQFISEAPSTGFDFSTGKDYVVIFAPDDQLTQMGDKIISNQNLDPTQVKNWFSYWTADWAPKLFTLYDCPNEEQNSWGGDVKLNMTPLFAWGAGDFVAKEGYSYDLSAITEDHILHIGFMNIGSDTSKPCFKFQLGPTAENGFSLEVNQPVGEMLGEYSGVGYAEETHKWYYLDIPVKTLIDEDGDFGFVYDFSEPFSKAFSCGFDIQPDDEASSVTTFTYSESVIDPDTGMYVINITELKSAMAVDHVFLYKKDSSGIENVTGTKQAASSAVYNLNGQKVSADYHGMVVKSGKTYIQK